MFQSLIFHFMESYNFIANIRYKTFKKSNLNTIFLIYCYRFTIFPHKITVFREIPQFLRLIFEAANEQNS